MVFFSGRRPNTGQLCLCVIRVTHSSCGTRLTKSPRCRSQFTYSASDLVMHFVGKVDKIRANTASVPPPRVVDCQCASGLSMFQQVTTGDIRRLISRAPCKHCDLDPAPTWLVKRAIDVVAPVIADVCNVSVLSGFFPQSQKLAQVTARLKKPSMDPDDLNSFSPISNLTLLSKIMERMVTKQFTSHAALNGLFPERPSAYSQFHSTESAVLALHNDTVCANDRGKVTGLVLLDLSSAFDTVDHTLLQSILESRCLVTGQSLAWFHSYLMDRAQVYTTRSSQTFLIPLT